jgi:hypothetical protein
MAAPAVRDAMTPDNSLASRSVAPDPRVIAAPQASDALAGVFRAAFGPTDDTPDDFRTLLAQLDREQGKH